MEKKRLDNISFLKVFMMIMVVLCHCMIFFGGNWFTYVNPSYSALYLYKIALWTNTFHIQTFTMVSGYLYFYLRNDKCRADISKKKYIIKKTKRLLIPFISTCFLWVIPIATYFYKYDLKTIINKYIFMRQPNQLWFIVMLFVIFVLVEIFYKNIKFSLLRLLFSYFFCVILGTILSHLYINFFQIDKAILYLFYFYLGGYIYFKNSEIDIKHCCVFGFIAFIFYLLMTYINSINNTLVHYFFVLLSPLLSSFQIIAIYYLFTYMIYRTKWINNNKFYKLLEENSFGIYLFHQQIIYFCIIFLNGVVHPIIQVILSFLISLFISLIMSIILKKHKITRFMFGL